MVVSKVAYAPSKRGSGNRVSNGESAFGHQSYTGMNGGSRVIVMACDEEYAMPLATTLLSLAESNSAVQWLEVVVFTSHFSAEMRSKVLRSVPDSLNVRFMPIEMELFKAFFTQPHVSKMTFARILLPLHFPENVSRILYLDTDIVVTDELSPLFSTDLDGAVFGAVVDVDAGTHARRLGLRHATGMGTEAPQFCDYFNAGVLLIDVARWRQERISERAIEYLVKNPQMPLMDQDALNVVYAGRWKQLAGKWNYQDHFQTRVSDLPKSEVAIVHFLTELKPWNPAVVSVNASFYNSFRSRTCFSRKLSQVVLDALIRNWCRCKRYFRRYRPLLLIWDIVIKRRGSVRVFSENTVSRQLSGPSDRFPEALAEIGHHSAE